MNEYPDDQRMGPQGNQARAKPPIIPPFLYWQIGLFEMLPVRAKVVLLFIILKSRSRLLSLAGKSYEGCQFAQLGRPWRACAGLREAEDANPPKPLAVDSFGGRVYAERGPLAAGDPLGATRPG